jgi:hypothetical protein
MTEILNLSDPNNRFDPDNFKTVFGALVKASSENINIVTGTLTATVETPIIQYPNDDRKSLLIQNTGSNDMQMVITAQNGTKYYLTIPAQSALPFNPIEIGSIHGLSTDKNAIIEEYIIKCEWSGALVLISTLGTTYEVLEIS